MEILKQLVSPLVMSRWKTIKSSQLLSIEGHSVFLDGNGLNGYSRADFATWLSNRSAALAATLDPSATTIVVEGDMAKGNLVARLPGAKSWTQTIPTFSTEQFVSAFGMTAPPAAKKVAAPAAPAPAAKAKGKGGASSSAPFAGQTLVVTGTVPGFTRDAFARAIAALGGFVANAINSSTTMLVVAHDAGAAKIKEAEGKAAKGQALEIIQMPAFMARFPVVFSGPAPEEASAEGDEAEEAEQPAAKAKGKAAAAPKPKAAAKPKAEAAAKPKATAGAKRKLAEVDEDAGDAADEEPAAAAKPPAKKKAKAASAAPAAAAAAPAASGSALRSVYLECHEGSSNKYHRMTLQPGNNVLVEWGAMGAKPTSVLKEFDAPEQAAAFMSKTEAEKRKKGYA